MMVISQPVSLCSVNKMVAKFSRFSKKKESNMQIDTMKITMIEIRITTRCYGMNLTEESLIISKISRL